MNRSLRALAVAATAATVLAGAASGLAAADLSNLLRSRPIEISSPSITQTASAQANPFKKAWKRVKKKVKKGITIPLNPPGGWKF